MGVPGLFAYLKRRYPTICSVPDPPRRRGGGGPGGGSSRFPDDTIDPTGHSSLGRRPVDNLYIDMNHVRRRPAACAIASPPLRLLLTLTSLTQIAFWQVIARRSLLHPPPAAPRPSTAARTPWSPRTASVDPDRGATHTTTPPRLPPPDHPQLHARVCRQGPLQPEPA